jgi:hypothetical protein
MPSTCARELAIRAKASGAISTLAQYLATAMTPSSVNDRPSSTTRLIPSE